MRIHSRILLSRNADSRNRESRERMYGPGGDTCVVGSEAPTAHVNKEPCGRSCSVSPRSSRIFFRPTDSGAIPRTRRDAVVVTGLAVKPLKPRTISRRGLYARAS